MIDLVSVIYTDEQGLPRTEVNVALPWSKTLVLNPGVDFESVTATSLTGQLNCAITDAAGTPVVAQNNNSMIATCTG
ncbi:MmpS3 protein [Mycolicibacterium tokaiense]|uniref:MmpS3 protein n=2 Tax=Mycolicibacterium TaxID=1866885 RepID=A0A378TB34_9MYCO|nr:MmpS3 protein [Mycolicibacterium tokaiense]